ncbi:hypothetical protein [Tepidibacillus sp. HK-1]|uniref:hypothetical protein n=1 Tax=Tepidibacillus sp. HK-1 TaxID=1883407 RepID=UPI000852E45B|nr:hypothetical protein [Tepidibacillus sp. HK-1]GBF10315.1 hypothetical protein HK1_00327 [Tepidibacillus sp. HK-1]
MKKFAIISLISIIIMTLSTGCQSNTDKQIPIKMKSQEEQMQIQNNYTYDDYKHVYEEVLLETEKFDIKDAKLKKWVIRTLIQEKLNYETDLTQEQVLQLSKEKMNKEKAWKEIAAKEYGIKLKDNEIDQYIKDSLDTVDVPKQMKAYADVLGLSIEDLNYRYDRDLYEKNLIWEKLIPKLEEKYSTNDMKVLLQKYNEEVDNTVKSIGPLVE